MNNEQIKYTITEARHIAQEQGFDRMIFYLHAPITVMKCQWIDAYEGTFKIFDPSIKPDQKVKDFMTGEIFVTLEQ